MNKKFVFLMLLFGIMAAIPWIWIYRQYGGLNDIPHYDLMMWDFMLDYFLLFGMMFIGILAAVSESDEEPPKMKNKPYKPLKTERKSSAAQKKKSEKRLRVKRERKPRSRKKQVKPENGTGKLDQIEHPAEWDEEEFE